MSLTERLANRLTTDLDFRRRPHHDLGIVRQDPDGAWRWECGTCGLVSVGAYPTDGDAWEGLTRHADARQVVHP